MSHCGRVRLHSRSLHKVDARCLIQDFCRNGLLPELFFERQFGTELRRKSLGLKRIAIKWQQQSRRQMLRIAHHNSYIVGKQFRECRLRERDFHVFQYQHPNIFDWNRNLIAFFWLNHELLIAHREISRRCKKHRAFYHCRQIKDWGSYKAFKTAINPACSKCLSAVSAYCKPSWHITTNDAQSTNPQFLSRCFLNSKKACS